MASSRETGRDSLTTLLAAALTDEAKTITSSKITNLKGLTPLVSVLSGGTRRERVTFQGDKPTFYLEVQVWVRQACTGWTNSQAEDALDTIEALIAGVYESNRGTTDWAVLEYDGPSRIREVAVAGILYFVETISTLVQLTQS